jgi:hypothetical protein
MAGFKNSILGGAETLIRSAIKSFNYIAGVAGWRIARDGSAEFATATIRGTIVADGGNIVIDGTGIHVTGTTRLWEIDSTFGFLSERIPDDGTDAQIIDAALFLRPAHPTPLNGFQLASAGQVFAGNQVVGPDEFPFVNLFSPAYTGKPGSGAIQLAGQSGNSVVDNSSVHVVTGASGFFNVTGGPIQVNGVTPGAISQTIFTAGGTWTMPTGAKFVRVRCIAGGGGGGNAGATGAAQNSAGSGGGAGSYSESLFAASALTSTVTVTVGAGGVASTAGSNSSFGAFVTANGGPAGNDGVATASATTNSAGGGGVGTGQITSAGGASQIASVFAGGTATHVSTTGGTSVLGAGGFGGRNFAGGPGLGFGSGGGGAGNNPSLALKSGGTGAAGIVIVETYF